MGMRTVLFGYISGFVPRDEVIASEVFEQNRRAVESLPAEDEWPCLVSSMFHMNPPGIGLGAYGGYVIKIGGSFKEMESDWEAWKSKFEALLRRMYWTHVVIVLDTEYGCRRYDWIPTQRENEGLHAELPLPVDEWSIHLARRDSA